MKTVLSRYRIHANLCLQQGQSRLIILSPDEYDTVAISRIISYIYHNTYDDVKALPLHEPQSWENPSCKVDTAGADYIPSRILANAAVHALADFFNMPDLQAFPKARFRMLAPDFWKPALPHLPEIIRAVFGTQGNDHPDLQGPVLERCVGIYKNIVTDPGCIEAMDTHPNFSRGLLQAVGKHLEDEQTSPTNQNKQLLEDIDVLTLTAGIHEVEKSSMHSALCDIHKKLNNVLLTRRGFTSSGRCGGGEVHGKGNAALKEDIKSAIRILLPYLEDETQGWVEECNDRVTEWTSGEGW